MLSPSWGQKVGQSVLHTPPPTGPASPRREHQGPPAAQPSGRRSSRADDAPVQKPDLAGPRSGTVSANRSHILPAAPPQHGDKFLIFECVPGQGLCGGWADRQRGMATVFLLAQLTHRRFGIRMSTPCDLNTFVVPNHYNWTVPDSEILGKPTRRIHAIDFSSFSREISTLDFNARYPEDVVFLQTNVDLLKDLKTNPHYRDVLPPWARQPRPCFFRDVWRTLMKPAPPVLQRMESFLQSVRPFNRTRPLVGVHVRTGGSANFSDKHLGDRLSHLNVLWDFVQRYVKNGSDVFVATDNPEVSQSSKARFGPHHHDTAAVLRHIDRQRSDPAICTALRDAILDQMILTRCDVLVVSRLSGFSRRAAMLRGSDRQLFQLDGDRVSAVNMHELC
ncbi:uncharacterized protein LOC143287878 [Babylonia areolata]|uniref:uncharacterized protein LOC143287878 n=1 Tax=Babylonia areolata TaxID=304850 RepID=UPI003FD1A295